MGHAHNPWSALLHARAEQSRDHAPHGCTIHVVYTMCVICRSVTIQPVMQVTAAIVTCGGLCPGLNDVIANIVTTLEDYGVPDDRIFGIRYGLRGFVARDCKPVNLNRALVDGIHLQGGTMLVYIHLPAPHKLAQYADECTKVLQGLLRGNVGG